MAWNDIPRTHSFSLSDFHDFDRCTFRFFVNHHLGKKYELAEGSSGQAIGSLLDLTMKKIHMAKAYNQPLDYLRNFLRAAEIDMKTDVAERGSSSFYGSQISFVTPEVIEKVWEIFAAYHQGLGGKFKPLLPTPTLKKLRPFWKKVVEGEEKMQIWGGPDAIEMGEDGIPEVVDYKYFRDVEAGKESLDMDLMPKVYTLLCAEELAQMGFSKVRFKVRLWQDPLNEDFYEEFDLTNMPNMEAFFKDKMERILRTSELSFCEKPFCKVCNHQQKEEWIKELKELGLMSESVQLSATEPTSSSGLPF